WAETSYKLANIWNQFQIVTTYNTEIDYLPVSGTLTLNGNIRPLGTPTVEIMPEGNLNVLGTAPFNTKQFILRPQIQSYVVTTYNKPYYSQLINEYDAITAQSAKIDMSVYGNRWYYFSFPFDVAMVDITIDEDAYYVFRYYDGESRATVGAGSSWKNVGLSDTLRAGTGYIFQCNKNVNHLVLPATGTSKNRLFASTAQAVALNAYPAENAANQNWNLAGNPFPSYYDIRCLDYTAPITYWNDYYSRYEAVSPVDDAFLLHPMQAFFVQKPADLNAITFTPEGRQTSPDPQTRSALRSASSLSRTLINLTLSDENFSDKSRIVLNPDAQLAYEMERDAAKFMSTAPEAPQLYSIGQADVHYAINERPTGDGIVPLGFYTGNAGNYTLALKEQVEDYEILLKDKDLNVITDLQAENYPFNAGAGTFDNRFELKITKTGTNVTGYSAPENQNTIVYAAKGAIVVENGIGAIAVYTINGAKLAVVNASGTQNTIPAPQGIYIVKVNGKVYKTVVL
ncbi:MAG: T9SS type A sorting domain-containing protein, partial [Dysgonamonadaceae bacterium]|nr:T9SS type A sorting domain-containing protein [Dysgonamonadaceae bacterium]